MVEIAPGAWFVQGDWLSCNYFVAKSPQLTLIDTGFRGDRDGTIASLRALGAAPEDLELIVNTHCHCDHAGNNKFFAERSGCEVWMHAREKERIDRRDDIGTWWRFHDTWADFFDVDRGLEEGDEIPFGPLRLRVVYAPGHSSGLMVLHEERLKLLFSADAMWQGDMGVINPLVEGEDALARAVETLERLDRLGLETVYPGHGPVITSPKPVIERLLRKLDRYQKEPKLMHDDHLRKMFAYIILLRGGVREAEFFGSMMAGVFYRQVVDRYFDSAYDEVYRSTIESIVRSRMVVREDGYLRGVGKK